MSLPRRLVIVTTSLPPHAESHTNRIRHLLRTLDESEWRLTLISPGRCPDGDAAAAALRWSGDLKWIQAESQGRAARLFAFGSRNHRLSWLLRNLQYRLAYPDSFGFWRKSAGHALRACLNEGSAYVMTSSGSPVSHLAALDVLGGTERHRWIAEFGDPWADVDKLLRPHWYLRSRQDEARTLCAAGAVLCTTEETRKVFQKASGGRANCFVLPYGYERPVCSPPSKLVEQRPAIVSYLGAAHVGDRDLRPLIEALSSDCIGTRLGLKRKLILGGDYSREFVTFAASRALAVEDLGRIAYEEALRRAIGSDCQVIVGNRSESQVPGKVFVCLSIPRPILYLSQAARQSDPSRQFLENFGGVIYADNNASSVRQALMRLADDYQDHVAASEERLASEMLASLDARVVSSKFRDILASMSER